MCILNDYTTFFSECALLAFVCRNADFMLEWAIDTNWHLGNMHKQTQTLYFGRLFQHVHVTSWYMQVAMIVVTIWSLWSSLHVWNMMVSPENASWTFCTYHTVIAKLSGDSQKVLECSNEAITKRNSIPTPNCVLKTTIALTKMGRWMFIWSGSLQVLTQYWIDKNTCSYMYIGRWLRILQMCTRFASIRTQREHSEWQK